MSQPVGYKRDEIFIIAIRPLSNFLIQDITDFPNQVNIFPLVITPDVVRFTGRAFMKSCFKSVAMVMNKQPVPDIFTLTINGDLVVIDSAPNYHGD
jgi:hypothetical protein